MAERTRTTAEPAPVRRPAPAAEAARPPREHAAPVPDESPVPLRLAAHLGGAAPAERLGEGRPLDGGTRARMERGLHASLAHVRLHDGPGAASVAGSLGADAFAWGGHVALGSAAPRAGTFSGDLLLAHELAHAAQQRGAAGLDETSSYDALEEDADRAALGAMTGTATGVGRASGMRLQLKSCFTSDAQIEAWQLEMRTLLADPDANEATIMAALDTMGGVDLEDVVGKVSILANPTMLADLGRLPSGRRIMTRMLDLLAGASPMEAKEVRLKIEKALADRKDTVTPAANETAEMAQVQAAIDAETPEVKKMYAGVSPPLNTTVKIYQPGNEEVGQVYYDPRGMPRKGKGITAGVTTTGGGPLTLKRGGTVVERHDYMFGSYIRLGPLVLAETAEYVRTALFHEFHHYRLAIEKKKGAASADVAARDLSGMNTAAMGPNEDTEILGLQFAQSLEKLSRPEMTSLLAYLATQLETTNVMTAFRDRAFKRIIDAAAAAPAAVRRTLADAIKALPSNQQALLVDLQKAIVAMKLGTPAPSKVPAKKGP